MRLLEGRSACIRLAEAAQVVLEPELQTRQRSQQGIPFKSGKGHWEKCLGHCSSINVFWILAESAKVQTYKAWLRVRAKKLDVENKQCFLTVFGRILCDFLRVFVTALYVEPWIALDDL